MPEAALPAAELIALLPHASYCCLLALLSAMALRGSQCGFFARGLPKTVDFTE